MALGTIATDTDEAPAACRAVRRAFEALAPGHRRAYLRWNRRTAGALRIAGMAERLNQGRAERSNGEG
jgi:hypothetical protein